MKFNPRNTKKQPEDPNRKLTMWEGFVEVVTRKKQSEETTDKIDKQPSDNGIDPWSVTWDKTTGYFSHEVEATSRFFLNKEDAREFEKDLREAFTITRCTGAQNIKVKQENN